MSTIITDKRNFISELEAALPEGWNSQPAVSSAWAHFIKTGLPGPKNEEYKFAPIGRFLEKLGPICIASAPVQMATPMPGFLGNTPCNTIAFIDGWFSFSNLVDKGITVKSVDPANPDGPADPFEHLNAAFSPTVTEIKVAAGEILLHPVVILYYATGQATFSNPRWKISLGNGCKATVLEMSGEHAHQQFQNKKSLIEVGSDASLEYLMLQNGTPHLIELNNTELRMAGSSYASCFTVTLDGRFVRNNLRLVIDGGRVESHLYGLYMPSGDSLFDNHTVVDHRQPESFSNELYKGVMNDRSRGIFNGKIYVRPQAQKTNAFQSNRNILLTDSATVNTKPQLEIWADDVKCSHGCTTGQLDEEAIFYLRSRGIDKKSAHAMLLHAFVAETFASLKNEIWKDTLERLVNEKLLNA